MTEQSDTPENIQKPTPTDELRQTADDEPVVPFQANPNEVPYNEVENPPQPPQPEDEDADDDTEEEE